ncbi:MAG: hypothetical protein NC201_00215 [Prevotella sp.]|nr:hypothetical protein [Bacteroides sp.]MCM1365652.1 hypothetical protein [Prevotella sp.]
MITEQVIKDIYKKFNKPSRPDDLNFDYYMDMLSEYHNFIDNGDEIIIQDLDDFNPFKIFLKRALYAVLEFDKWVAFVFPNHILFFSKVDNNMSVHFRPDEKKGLLDKIFGR